MRQTGRINGPPLHQTQPLSRHGTRYLCFIHFFVTYTASRMMERREYTLSHMNENNGLNKEKSNSPVHQKSRPYASAIYLVGYSLHA